MLKLIALLQTFAKEDDGATAIEYGLIAAGIALTIAAAVFLFGGQLNDLFTNMGGALEGTAP